MFVAVVAFFVGMQLNKKGRYVSVQIPFNRKTPRHALSPFVRVLSLILHIGALFFLSWAFIHFSVGSGPFEKYVRAATLVLPPPSPADSRQLFFLIDRSGSMAEPMPGTPEVSKIRVVKDGLEKCISLIDSNGGENDLLGLVTLARAAKIEAPLSRDRSFLSEAIAKIVPETNERLNGTAIGYGIFKSVSLIVACRAFETEEKISDEQEGNTVILVTDGLEEPNPADRSHPFRSMRTLQALTYAKENHVRVHYINVDKNSYRQLLPDERDRLMQAVEATGGQYFEITINQSLGQVMSQIAQTEEMKKAPPSAEGASELGFWLIVIALIMMSSSRLLETACVRVSR